MAVLFTDRQTVPHILWPGCPRVRRSAHATMLSRDATINIDRMFVFLQALVQPAHGASLVIRLHSFPVPPSLPFPLFVLGSLPVLFTELLPCQLITPVPFMSLCTVLFPGKPLITPSVSYS